MENKLTFFSRCGDTRSSTELKLCNGELRSLPGLIREPPFTASSPASGRGGDTRLVGDVSLLPTNPGSGAELLMGEMVRSGDRVIRWVIILMGEFGESMFRERARVSAISRRACSLKRTCLSSYVFVNCILY